MTIRTTRTSAALTRPEADNLRALLRAEAKAYGELLDLARRQNDWLRSQDVVRLAEVVAAWTDRLPAAEDARRAREAFLLDLGRRHGIETDELRMSRLARSTPGDPGRELRADLRAWEETTGELMRQNALNGLLADFCLDLVGAEADILRRGVSGKDGCYDATGGEATGACAGAIVKQA